MVIVSTLEVFVNARSFEFALERRGIDFPPWTRARRPRVKKKMKPFVRELGSTLELEADLRRFGKLQHLILELV